MALGDVNPSSFEAYEGIRILLPGTIAVSIYAAVVATYSPSTPSPASNAFAGFIAALLVGLALLFLDLPVKSAAYRNPYLPDRELRAWGIDPKPFGDYLNLYFVMLDVAFPATIRNRSLYMGAIFRIGFEGLYLLGLAAIGVIATAAAFPETGPLRGGTTSTKVVLFLVAGAHVVIFVGALITRLRYRLRRPEAKWAPSLRGIATESLRDVGVLGVLAMLIGLGALVAFICSHSAAAALALTAVGVPTGAWAVKYFRGRPPRGDEEQRRRLSPPAALVLYAGPCIFACVGAALRTSPRSTIDTTIALAWGSMTLASALLIASRGHERKLNGSFTAQTTWMRMNKEALIESHKLQTSDSK